MGSTHISQLYAVIALLIGYISYQRYYIDGDWTANSGIGTFNGTWDSRRDSKNLLLTADQCNTAFPLQNEPVKLAVRSRFANPITYQELDDGFARYQNGTYRAVIFNNELYVVGRHDLHEKERAMATLQQIHRAVITSPELLPNIEFLFTVRDQTLFDIPIWSYCKKEQHRNTWIIPDHGFWAWPGPKVGSYGEFRTAARRSDFMNQGSLSTSWDQKIGKLVWRGALLNLTTRYNLLATAQGHAWADVEVTNWSNRTNLSSTRLEMGAHCRYKYVAHTEGITYSGRLKYLQNCRSVVILPRMKWPEFHDHLMIDNGPDQNVVRVKEDWSDLPAKVSWLQSHDGEAERIAHNGLQMFGNRYLSPAAETCYLRSVIRGWASVSFEANIYETNGSAVKLRGPPFESYALERELDWEIY